MYLGVFYILELFTVGRVVDLQIFHTNAYWTCFSIKLIQSFGEEVERVVVKVGAVWRGVEQAALEDYGYHLVKMSGWWGRGWGGWLKRKSSCLRKCVVRQTDSTRNLR